MSNPVHLLYHELQWTASPGASAFSFSPMHLLLECVDLHSPFREINASFHPFLFPTANHFSCQFAFPIAG